MKNITVTLDDETAAWARVHAAQKNMSLSRFLGDLLHRTMGESQEYEVAMARFLAMKPMLLSDGNTPYPKREELYDRPSLR
jgi:hypothetical protein